MLMGDLGICLQISWDQDENRWLSRGGISGTLGKPPGFHFLLSEMEVPVSAPGGLRGLGGQILKGWP